MLQTHCRVLKTHSWSHWDCDSAGAWKCCRECEQSALFMRSKDLNFNTDEEQESVELIFNQALDILKEEDRGLNFIETLLPLLKRGIGVHHSGLLPILKEVIELLFQEQLIKVGVCSSACGKAVFFDSSH